MELGSLKPKNIWSHQKLEEAKKASPLWNFRRSRESREEAVALIQVSNGGGHDQGVAGRW